MVRSALFAIASVFFCTAIVSAATLSFEDIAVSPGDTLRVGLFLDNSVEIRGLQLSVLHMPSDGITFTGLATTNRTSGWTFSSSALDGGVMIIGYSPSGGTIAAGDSAIVTLSYFIASDISTTDIELNLSEVSLSDANNSSVTDVQVENGTLTVSTGEPLASFTVTPQSGQAPLEVSFDASGSSDSDGSIDSYEWDFGDQNLSTGSTTNHLYENEGTYTITLTVTDNDGNTASTTSTVVVFTEGEYARGDVNRDNKTDIFDLLELLKILGGKVPN